MNGLDNFKSFILKGNILDFAIGMLIGTAVVELIKSMMSDIIMPGVGLAIGNVDLIDIFIVLKEGTITGPYKTLADAQANGAVTLNIGKFFDTVSSFLAISYVTYIFIKNIDRLKGSGDTSESKPAVKDCPFCFTTIPLNAIRCPNCTSHLKEKSDVA